MPPKIKMAKISILFFLASPAFLLPALDEDSEIIPLILILFFTEVIWCSSDQLSSLQEEVG